MESADVLRDILQLSPLRAKSIIRCLQHIPDTPVLLDSTLECLDQFWKNSIQTWKSADSILESELGLLSETLQQLLHGNLALPLFTWAKDLVASELKGFASQASLATAMEKLPRLPPFHYLVGFFIACVKAKVEAAPTEHHQLLESLFSEFPVPEYQCVIGHLACQFPALALDRVMQMLKREEAGLLKQELNQPGSLTARFDISLVEYLVRDFPGAVLPVLLPSQPEPVMTALLLAASPSFFEQSLVSILALDWGRLELNDLSDPVAVFDHLFVRHHDKIKKSAVTLVDLLTRHSSPITQQIQQSITRHLASGENQRTVFVTHLIPHIPQLARLCAERPDHTHFLVSLLRLVGQSTGGPVAVQVLENLLAHFPADTKAHQFFEMYNHFLLYHPLQTTLISTLTHHLPQSLPDLLLLAANPYWPPELHSTLRQHTGDLLPLLSDRRYTVSCLTLLQALTSASPSLTQNSTSSFSQSHSLSQPEAEFALAQSLSDLFISLMKDDQSSYQELSSCMSLLKSRPPALILRLLFSVLVSPGAEGILRPRPPAAPAADPRPASALVNQLTGLSILTSSAKRLKLADDRPEQLTRNQSLLLELFSTFPVDSPNLFQGLLSDSLGDHLLYYPPTPWEEYDLLPRQSLNMFDCFIRAEFSSNPLLWDLLGLLPSEGVRACRSLLTDQYLGGCLPATWLLFLKIRGPGANSSPPLIPSPAFFSLLASAIAQWNSEKGSVDSTSPLFVTTTKLHRIITRHRLVPYPFTYLDLLLTKIPPTDVARLLLQVWRLVSFDSQTLAPDAPPLVELKTILFQNMATVHSIYHLFFPGFV